MRRVTHERYISQSQRANCDLVRRYVGLNLSQHAIHEVGRLCYPSLPNCILLHYFSHSDLDSRELRIGSYYVVLLFILRLACHC